jgi:hypothetical protein
VSAAFVFYSVAGRWRGSCWLDLNEGGLALQFFERHVINLLHAGLLDLDADEFRFSYRRCPLFGMEQQDI